MNKKLFYLLFLAISISSTSFASKDPTKISRAEQTYYENNREWDYLEKILIKDLNKVSSKTNTVINYVATGAFIVPTTFIIYKLQTAQLNNDGFILASAVSTILTGLFAGLTKGLWNEILHKKIHKEKLTNVLEMFLQKYNTATTDTNNNINYQNIIPEELHKTFNDLYKGYKSLGKEFLEKNGLEILYSIIDKITYEIKETKYQSMRKEQIAKRYNNTLKEMVKTRN